MVFLLACHCRTLSLFCRSNFPKNFSRINNSLYFSTSNITRSIVLGIETSCDDTGCAIVDESGKILGGCIEFTAIDTPEESDRWEGILNITDIHAFELKFIDSLKNGNGGIIPPIAQDLHRNCIESVVDFALNEARLSISDIDAIAVTNRPGLPLSLLVGLKYAKYLSREFSKPVMPIHHMEAHALMARMEHKIEYPFLVLLISGGHCLLAVVNDVDDFKLLGQTIDDAPGEAFDKTARRMKLRNLKKFSELAGGQAIELAATFSENPQAFDLAMSMMAYRDCNFSMAGLKNSVLRQLFIKEKKHNIEADGVIPEVFDLCAAFQTAITRHLCQRTQRAMEYVNITNMIPENNRTLVVSGGVACNNYIAKCLTVLCKEMGYNFVRPRSKLCTDNGIMIAWNGIERLNKGIGIQSDIDTLNIHPKCELGVDISNDVLLKDIKCKWVKLKV